MKIILQKEAPVLRDIAKEVNPKEILSPKIQKIIKEMKRALAKENDGVAIAAPQIGYSLRIFVVAGKVKNIVKNQGAKANTDTEGNSEVKYKDSVYINPVIIKLSKEKKMVEEGCLSVRYLYGKVNRSTRASIKAYNENAELINQGASGLLAQIFQHETDHLNGVLFIDSAKEVKEIKPPAYAKATTGKNEN